ncbi:MAG: DNA-3-methyladenine glycosylase, partial [Anaerolineales bacterium]
MGARKRDFFRQPTLEVSRKLLGSVLVRQEPDGSRLSGWVTETEAYIGQSDLACHARHGKTDRNRAMWGSAGHAYVYFTYGMHWMLNVVTEAESIPAAVLLRGILPHEGIEKMRIRRGGKPDRLLTDGPAKLCQALAIDDQLYGEDICQVGGPLWFEAGVEVPDDAVTNGPRVGLNHVPEPWLSQPWRFV